VSRSINWCSLLARPFFFFFFFFFPPVFFFFFFFFWSPSAWTLFLFGYISIFISGCGFGYFCKRITFAFSFGPLLAIFSCSLP
jgi:hypothetical protein